MNTHDSILKLYNDLSSLIDPTWVDPVAESWVDSAWGVTQVGSIAHILRADSDPGRVNQSFQLYARLGLRPHRRAVLRQFDWY